MVVWSRMCSSDHKSLGSLFLEDSLTGRYLEIIGTRVSTWKTCPLGFDYIHRRDNHHLDAGSIHMILDVHCDSRDVKSHMGLACLKILSSDGSITHCASWSLPYIERVAAGDIPKYASMKFLPEP